ncbi:MAG: hypothetical protein ACE5OZ_20360 [Candidatus Heimdallarchaeota archaeon]
MIPQVLFDDKAKLGGFSAGGRLIGILFAEFPPRPTQKLRTFNIMYPRGPFPSARTESQTFFMILMEYNTLINRVYYFWRRESITSESMGLEGIHLEEKPGGMTITFNGKLYQTLAKKVHDGTITRQFYHQLRIFVTELSNLIESE